MRSSFQNRCQVFARCGFALLLFQCCGCAHVAVVKLKPARLPKTFVAKGPLESANKYLAAAKHEQPLPALGHDLLAAKLSYGELERRPEDKSARDLYNFAVARTLQDIEQSNLQPWRHPAIVATDQGNYILSSPKPIDAEHDPSQYDRIPTDTLKIAGLFFENHSTTDGFGAPIVAGGLGKTCAGSAEMQKRCIRKMLSLLNVRPRLRQESCAKRANLRICPHHLFLWGIEKKDKKASEATNVSS